MVFPHHTKYLCVRHHVPPENPSDPVFDAHITKEKIAGKAQPQYAFFLIFVAPMLITDDKSDLEWFPHVKPVVIPSRRKCTQK